jgi:hypothetical protein
MQPRLVASKEHPMTSLAAALRPALAALDLALADTAPGAKGQPSAPRAVEDACRLLHENTVALGNAIQASCDAGSSSPDLPALACTLYRCTADAVAGYHALADASQRDLQDIAWGRLLDFARDTLITLAHVLAELIAHTLHGVGAVTRDLNLTLPSDRADLQRMYPLRLAYARQMVQAALRDAQRTEDEAPRLARALQEGRADDARAAREMAHSIFWSQVAAAGLAVWLVG